MATPVGNQIFLSIKKGSTWPPTVFDLRATYESTLGELRAGAAARLGISAEKLQLFRHGKELSLVDMDRTLADLDMHTGFSVQGWDLSEEPEYWPPVKRGEDGLLIIVT
ncbi:hypothetical protein FOA52_008658 [Chlamydomonas sp. UWO 241]|nr:hypothetical protein FOA52_008658 [Chlamydomonas sp. UWO 241]